MKNTLENNKKDSALTRLLFSSLFFVGMFHEFVSCIYAICFAILLCYRMHKKGSLTVYLNPTGIAIGVLCLFYLLSVFWAVDAGSALIGFFKYLPLGLFLLCLMDEPETSKEIQRGLPYVAAVMTVLSILGMQIPTEGEYFVVSDRLAGFFQYPNSFAMLLLAAELFLLQKEKFKKTDYGVVGILIVGIFMSGSRIVLVLAVISNVIMLISLRQRWTQKGAKIGAVVAFISAATGAFMMFQYDVLHRLAEFSLTESTLVGRFLYFQDALPVILKHPLGLGLNGYLYTQSSFQTGVYSVKFVHNDFLQLMLDVGWVPCLLLLFAIGKTLCSKTNSPQKKIILCTFLAHFCFDFDLQYISMFCIFLTLLDFDGGKILVIENRPAKLLKWSCIPLAALCLYMGVALGSSYLGLYHVSYSLYPWNADNESRLIMETEDPVEMEMLADDVLRRNPYLVLAWTAKASVAYQNGDMSSVMQYKHHIFDIAPFAYDEYEEYCQMLIAAYQMYVEAGDLESAKVCAEELRTTRESLEQLPSKLSDLGTKIADQPKTKLPKEIDDYIDTL